MNTIKRCQPLLGTFVEITLSGAAPEARLHQHAGKAFEMIRCVQRMMSFHDPDSDISRLNRCGHLAPLQVHPWTYHVLDEAVKLSRETEGAFDITGCDTLLQVRGELCAYLGAYLFEAATLHLNIIDAAAERAPGGEGGVDPVVNGRQRLAHGVGGLID